MKVPFKLDGPFTEIYFGKDRTRAINYREFSQFLHDFHEECALEAFKLKDTNRTGFITALDFQDIMLNVKNHLLTDDVRNNLIAVRIIINNLRCKRGINVFFLFFSFAR
jgi:solute carrier family 25 aspartate/glutamate transporter 12/13